MNNPLILLDVDGVINDLHRGPRPWRTDLIRSHGYFLRIPEFMPTLIRRLTRRAEVHWCTTWRDRANDEIAAHLGIGPLPVVDDGTNDRYVGWKPAAAYAVAEAALAEGRTVYWIEDFYGRPPTHEMPRGVVFVDTAATADGRALTPGLLPEELWVPTDLLAA